MRTLKRINEQFRWPGMVKDVANMIGLPYCVRTGINGLTCRLLDVTSVSVQIGS